MKLGAADPTSEGSPNRHLAVVSAARTRAVPRQLRPDLMEGLRREAEKLNLCDWHHPGDRQAQRGADDARLSERRIDDALCAMFLQQTGRSAEDASQFSNVEPEDHDFRIPRHLLIRALLMASRTLRWVTVGSVRLEVLRAAGAPARADQSRCRQ